jgi:cobalt/nickel transport protein
MKDKFIFVALGVSALVAGGLSLFASSDPDGLERVAEDLGFITTAEDSVVAGSPLADYGIAGIDATWASTVSGVAGIFASAVVGYGLYLWMKAPKA